jgi:hypothetical protein
MKTEERMHYLTRCVTEKHATNKVKSLEPVHQATDSSSYHERVSADGGSRGIRNSKPILMGTHLSIWQPWQRISESYTEFLMVHK